MNWKIDLEKRDSRNNLKAAKILEISNIHGEEALRLVETRREVEYYKKNGWDIDTGSQQSIDAQEKNFRDNLK